MSNTSEWIKHKFWDCIQARRAWRWTTFIMHELCGVNTGNYNSFNWKQTLFGEGFRRSSHWKLNISTSFEASHFGPFGLSAMTTSSTAKISTNPRSNIGFGMSKSCMPKPRGIRSSSKLRLVASWLWPCLETLISLGGLEMSFARDTIYISLGIGKIEEVVRWI